MRDRATLAQPDLAGTWQQVFPGTPDRLRQVRAALRTLLDGCPVTDDVALLVTELAANAIAHSGSGRPGRTLTVRVRHLHGHHVRAEVQDAGSDWHGDIAGSATHPHGLYLLLAWLPHAARRVAPAPAPSGSGLTKRAARHLPSGTCHEPHPRPARPD